MKTLDGHSRYVTSCAFSSDQSLLVTGSNDRTVIVWDLTGALGLDSELSQFPTFNSQLVSVFLVFSKNKAVYSVLPLITSMNSKVCIMIAITTLLLQLFLGYNLNLFLKLRILKCK